MSNNYFQIDEMKDGDLPTVRNLAEKIAKREEFKCMQLDTAQSAEHLLKFYQNYGFKIIRPIYNEGKTYCSWILEKPI